MPIETNELYEFGPFRADGLRRLLLRDGQPVPLTSRVFDTLLVLIQNRDRVLTKDDLLKTIWPGTFVEEANLAQNVSVLRRALGEIPGEHRYIATVPGRGYRFVADVVTTVAAHQPEVGMERRTTAELVVEEESTWPLGWQRPGARRLTVAAILLSVGLAWAGWHLWKRPLSTPDVTAARSIAVLPFHQLDDAGDKALGLGLADAVITKLSNIRRLVVRPTNAILKYGGDSVNARAAAGELDVEALLEGTLQKSRDRIRLNVQLVRAADQRPLWAETFDAAFTDIFAVEDAISEKVAQALAVKLAEGEKQRVDKRYTANLDAYRYYLEGRFSGFQFTPDGLQRSIGYFGRAIAIDPSYALAYSGLADAYTTASDWVLPPREAMPKAEAAARRALAYDDALAEAYGALAHAQLHEWKLAEARTGFARALALNPNITSIYFAYGEYLAAAGKQDEAIAEFRGALKIDPLSAEIMLMLPFPMYLKGDYHAAEAAGATAIQAHPDFWAPYMGRGYAYLAEGRFPESIADFERGRALNPKATINLSGLAAAHARAGHRKETLDLLARMQQMALRQYVAPFDIAVVYAALGDTGRALDWLDKAYQDQSEMLLFMDIYPPLTELRGNPRFRNLVQRVGVPRRN